MVSMKFVIFGSPGAGKGTYARRLHEHLGIAAVSTGDIFRDAVKQGTELGKNAKTFMDAGELVPDEITSGILEERLQQPDTNKGFILDGYPRTISQIKFLEKITKIDAVINLVVPEWILIERLTSRRTCKKCGKIYNILYLKPKKEGICDECGGELVQRSDEVEEVIKHRLKVFDDQIKPLLKHYRDKGLVIDIECNKIDTPPEIMVDKILKELKERKLIE